MENKLSHELADRRSRSTGHDPSVPRLCVVGPLTGANPQALPTQGEFLASALARSGYSVIAVSRHLNPIRRALDIASTLVRRRRRIDVQILLVFSHRSFAIVDLASLVGALCRHRIVMVLHGGALPRFSRRHPRWTRRVLRRAARVVAPSTYLADELAWTGVPIEVIPNALDLEQYPFEHRTHVRPRLLWMRCFDKVHHPEMALRAFSAILAEYPEAALTMAGPDYGLARSVCALADALGLTGRVSFPGFLDPSQKLSAGRDHDVFLNTNRVDNLPVTVLEMAAMGLPIVATNVGGIPHLLTDRENALLVPDSDEEAMAAAVIQLLRDHVLAGRLSHNGRLLAARFSWDQVLPLWQQLLAGIK